MKKYLRTTRLQLFTALLAATLFMPALAHAEALQLMFPTGTISQHDYFYELLDTALKEAGHAPFLDKVENFPHLRVWDMLKYGGISVMWLVRSKERDTRFLPIPIPLTNGLIGKRILLVPKDKQHQYAAVSTLDEFRAMNTVGGFGTNWFDTKVWKANGLPYQEVAIPNLIYAMVATKERGIDYFSRGFNEVVEEQADHPELAIEPHLMLQYDRDFIFYVSPTRPELVPIIADALTKARQSGLIDRLVKKHWAHNFKILKPESRTVIHLATPQ